VFALAAALLAAPAALADATGQGTLVQNGCMEDVAGFSLGCTANDVRVSGVADINGDFVVDQNDITFAQICDATAGNPGADCSLDPGVCTDLDGNSDPLLCGDKCAFPGDTTSFSATFIFELSAQKRWDVGAYFEILPDLLGDGALTGTCAIITLPEDETPFTRPDGSVGNFVDLDTTCTGSGCPEPEDLCGDIDDENNPIFYDMKGARVQADTITASCVDSDGDGKLNLPNCTSWRQSGANELCFNGLDAFPGSPSKCNCNPTFQLPIDVPAATIQVVKSANPTSVDEPGGSVIFSVDVTNQSPFAGVTINVLDDDIYGDITQVQGLITQTTCALPQALAAGVTYSCSFTAPVDGQGDTFQIDEVTATGIDANGNELEDSDTARVDIVDLNPEMAITKTADPTSVAEPGGPVEFTVVVTNQSLLSLDELTLTDLNDDIFGDITQMGGSISATDCSVTQTIAAGGNYSCKFTADVSGPAFSMETDTVTATANDEEGNELQRSDPATVTIVDVGSMCTATKTAAPNPIDESPDGTEVTFTVVVENTSTVDDITIDSLIDTPYGDLDGQGDCSLPQNVSPGGEYSCAFSITISGLGNTQATDTVAASGTDDDNQAVMCGASATVNIADVAPSANLVKNALMVVTTYEVVVTNLSTAESLELTALNDDKFGDITQVQGDVVSTTCAVPQTLAVDGGMYTCTFEGAAIQSPHTNTVTGTVEDDEGGSVTPSDSATVTFQ
jgi:hypothetical protein